MDYTTFKETLETFMNVETLIYSGATAGAALIAGAVGYLRGKSRFGYKIRMAEIDRDRTLASFEQRRVEVELEKIQAQTAPELERVRGENLLTGSQARLEQMARERELEMVGQRAEYEIEQKRSEYDEGLKRQRTQEEAQRLTQKLEGRRLRIDIIAERLEQRLEQYVQTLREYGQANEQTEQINDEFHNEREEFRRELADKLMKQLDEDHTITEEEYGVNEDDVERLDRLAGLKYPYPKDSDRVGRKLPVEPSRELKLILRLVGKKLD
ncbi:hypothetical protein J4429_04405 [Candidatus Pacearchaeota archaeon]|nr:hypothetical protein [Candidatus Pacearchaeota archaeon]